MTAVESKSDFGFHGGVGVDVEKKWAPPSGPEAQRQLKELYSVFGHVINKVWNIDLGGALDVPDTHDVR